MRAALRVSRHVALAAAMAVLPVDPATWVDDDRRAIPAPKEREKNLQAHEFREAIVEPLSHVFDIPDKFLALADLLGAETDRQSANVNDFDEVPNSTWFTNRNHVRALTLEEIRRGPGDPSVRPAPPYEVKSIKSSGMNPGFNVKDANGKRWVVKFDPPGHPQLSSGADAVVTRLLYAAGYNLPHDCPLTFRRSDLVLDPELLHPKDGSAPFTEAMLDTLLLRGARNESGLQYGQASLFLEGQPVGPIYMRGRRPDDPNDIYSHQNRRELRGLYVLMSWVGNWDTKDHQTLDTFIETGDSLGHVRHHLLDVNGSLGAAAEGPKSLDKGYEYRVDFGWMLRRMYTLGFAVEPWRNTNQFTGVPSVGNFTAANYKPNGFKPIQPHAAFRERTERDGYWGAKIVASFSDAQIEAAIQAAGYEDPRALPLLRDILIERRDAVMKYWFAKVAPLDFFHVDGSTLRFSDLAVDRRIAAPRRYDAEIRESDARPPKKDFELTETAIDLSRLPAGCTRVEYSLRVHGLDAAPATVRLERKENTWTLVHVRHA